MKLEDKQLLLKDLCARLPYGVICTDNRHGASKATEIDIESRVIYLFDVDEYVSVEVCRPYLRPMSSMTEEEKEEFISFNGTDGCYIKTMDFCNKHHLDNRGLVPMGLALEAPKGMYNL